MEGKTQLTTNLHDWLIELDKSDTAKFLKENCNIQSKFFSLVPSRNDEEDDLIISRIVIEIPLKKHRELQLYKEHVDEIEKCLYEYTQAHNEDIDRPIVWKPVLSDLNYNNIQPLQGIKDIVPEDYDKPETGQTLKEVFKIYTDYTKVIKLLKDNHYIDDSSGIVVWPEKHSKISKQHGLLQHLLDMKYLKVRKLTPAQKKEILKNTFNTNTTINTMERAVDYNKYVKEFLFIPAKK